MQLTSVKTLALSLACAAPMVGAAMAQDYPTRAIEMTVAYGAGGGTDTIARQLSEPMSEIFGQPVVVQNRPGAGGTIGAAAAAASDPDGYTLYMMAGGHAVAAAMYATLPYDPSGDFVGISGIADMPMILVTKPGSKYQTLDDLLSAAQMEPGNVAIASVGSGSTQNLASLLTATTLDIDVLQVPYGKTPEGLAAVLSGEVDMMMETVAATLGQVQAGDLHAIAVTLPERHPQLPDVPTFVEAGYDLAVGSWYGLAAPKGTDAAIVEKAGAVLAEALSDAAFKESLEKRGFILSPSSPAEFDAKIKADIERWQAVREAAGIPQN